MAARVHMRSVAPNLVTLLSRDEDPIFFPRIRLSWNKNSEPDPPLDPTLIRNGLKIHLYLREIGIRFDFINHHFKLDFVVSSLCFVQTGKKFHISVVTGRIRILQAKNQRIRQDPDPHSCC